MSSNYSDHPLKYTSPLVYQYSWGRVEVEGFGVYKDVILLPGSAEAWEWLPPNNDHASALTPELLSRVYSECEIVVLGLGAESKLVPSVEALNLTATWGPNVFLGDSSKAVMRYNELAQEGRRVGLILHTTC